MPSFHCRMSWSVQKRAWVVWSAVLVALSSAAELLDLVEVVGVLRRWSSEFGPSGRNCEALSSASGRIPGSRRPSTGPGPGCQTPGPAAGGSRSASVGFFSRPSFARSASTAAATFWPTAIPSAFAAPSGMAPR